MARAINPHTKQNIIDTAAALFFERGFYKVSVDELVAELRVSKGTIYRHFGNKEEIVETVLAQFNERRNAELAAIVQDDGLDFSAKLERVTTVTGQVLSQINERFYDDLRIHYPRLWSQYEQARAWRLDHYYRPMFQQGVAQNVIRADWSLEFLLMTYRKLTEIVIRPKSLDNLPITRSDAYKQVTQLFLEGARQR